MENFKTSLTFILLIGFLITLNSAKDHSKLLTNDGECLVEEDFVDHRSVIYMTRNSSLGQNGVVHIFKKITENIGLYGVIGFKQNDVYAQKAKKIIEKKIIDNVDANGAATSDWKTVFVKALEDVEKVRVAAFKNNSDTAPMPGAIMVVDGTEVTQLSIKAREYAEDTESWMSSKELPKLSTFHKLLSEIEDATTDDGVFLLAPRIVWDDKSNETVERLLKHPPKNLTQAAIAIHNELKNEKNEMDKGCILFEQKNFELIQKRMEDEKKKEKK